MTKFNNTLRKSAAYLNKTAKYIDNSTKIVKYWNPLDDTERQNIKKEVERIKLQKQKLIKKYIILWIVIVIITMVLCMVL